MHHLIANPSIMDDITDGQSRLQARSGEISRAKTAGIRPPR
jgi:hypothetical protein